MLFVLPETTADLLPFVASVVTLLLGLIMLVAPAAGLWLGLFGSYAGMGPAIPVARADAGGFRLGVGIMGLMMYDQPFLQFALGAGWAAAALGRLLSLVLDRGAIGANLVWLVLDLALTAMPLAPALGYVSAF
ncbi:AGROH133_08824 family phage infection protein [Mangrovibrevibacter kandeliae]|uniref:AGROH133_08824 family phage infection protein n=1 Tax=Mangrovibrevibacter kandeliae TaxID=2968473 RepID=UPI0021188BA0|nr:DUF4345 domain-containing protein [Aurantimonas sp. CSK15Z-1]MCQ8783025.1 DUF4345 domain-containing protein [Aurantimonas sp. CSK15Z-1]